MRLLGGCTVLALAASARAAETFVSTVLASGYEPAHLQYEAELVDNLELHAKGHAVAESHRRANALLARHLAREADDFAEAELVPSLHHAPLGAGERFAQLRMDTKAIARVEAGFPGDDLALGDYFQGGAPAGYPLTGNEFDNVLTSGKSVDLLPNAPDCKVSAPTVLEVKKLRRMALDMSTSVNTELDAMAQRKAYVEQMTSYINDRILDLNKVKGELATELRWVKATNAKIDELGNTEQLIKMQDIMGCLNKQSNFDTASSKAKADLLKPLSDKAKALKKNIDDLRKTIEQFAADKEPTAPPAF